MFLWLCWLQVSLIKEIWLTIKLSRLLASRIKSLDLESIHHCLNQSSSRWKILLWFKPRSRWWYTIKSEGFQRQATHRYTSLHRVSHRREIAISEVLRAIPSDQKLHCWSLNIHKRIGDHSLRVSSSVHRRTHQASLKHTLSEFLFLCFQLSHYILYSIL